MVEHAPGGDGPDDLEHLASHSDAARSNWKRTVEDMRAMASDREDRGLQTLAIPAGHTAPKGPAEGETDEWGLSYVIPGDKVDDFEYFYENGDFDDTAVYQSTVEGHVFIVTEHIDLRSNLVVFVAGSYEIRHAASLVRAATDRDVMYSLVKKLDGTLLGTFEHDDVSAFFPDPDAFLAYSQSG